MNTLPHCSIAFEYVPPVPLVPLIPLVTLVPLVTLGPFGDPWKHLKALGPPGPPGPPGLLGPLRPMFLKKEQASIFFEILDSLSSLFLLQDGSSEADADIHFYLWVPFVLFMKYVMFQIPNAIWKNLEGGLMKSFYSNGEIKSVDNKRRKIKNAKG